MTRYPRQLDREYLSYRSGSLNKIQMIDGGTLDLHHNLVASDRGRRYIVEHQLPTIFQQSDSFHASSPYERITGRPRGLPATSTRCASAAFVGAYSSTTRSFISPDATMLRSSSSHSVRSRTLDTVIGLILIPRSAGVSPQPRTGM